MAFYFNQGKRRDRGHERTALGPSPLKASTTATAGRSNPDSGNAHRTNKPKHQQQSQPQQQQQQRRRERIGETLRLNRSADRSGNPLRDIRLAKIFGEPVLDTSGNRHKITVVDAYSTRDILFNSAGRVSYGTWYGLIMYLTQAHQQMEEYMQAFFLTFRSFATPRDLAEALVYRSRLQPAHGLGQSDARLWQHRVKEPIQYRVFMAIKLWYEKHWRADTDDSVLSYLCGFLLNEYLPSRHGSSAKECVKFLQTVESKNKFIQLRQLRARLASNAEDATSNRSTAGLSGSMPGNTHWIDAHLEADSEKAQFGTKPHTAINSRGASAAGTATGAGHAVSTMTATPSSRMPIWPPNSTQTDAQASEAIAPSHNHRDSEHVGLLRKILSRGNIHSMPCNENNPSEQSQAAEETPDSSPANPDEPDITDLLMATVGMDLSLEAYRRISNILSLNPLDVACQLTIIESSCYCQIRPYELLNKEFSRRERSKAHNIRQMTQWSTQISRWASMLILKEQTPERRCRVLRYFIELGMQLLALKNYDALMAIKGAIYCAGVMRLKGTWSLLPKKFTIMCRRLLEAMNSDHNYANYRELLRKSQPPLLPFLGLYLTDLTFLEDGNPTYRRYVYPQEDSAAAIDGGKNDAGEDSEDSSSDDGYGKNGSIDLGRGIKSSSVDSDSITTSAGNNAPWIKKDTAADGRSIGSAEGTCEDHRDEQTGTGRRQNNVQLTGQTCALFAQRNEVDLNSPSILINFEKSYRIAGIIQEIQKFQIEYSGNFTMAIPGLQQYLIEQWRQYKDYDDDRIYELSLQREPRASISTQNAGDFQQHQHQDYHHHHHHHLSTGGGIRLSRLIPGRNKEQQPDGFEKRQTMSPIDSDDSGSSIY
ncbi:Ras guanine nucleotide exchange factor bud5 [Coemansia sp. RSA 2598]|nr:Ras guanine nucleotide exchange factor bud5 [Coemansia sp. RSA 2598]